MEQLCLIYDTVSDGKKCGCAVVSCGASQIDVCEINSSTVSKSLKNCITPREIEHRVSCLAIAHKFGGYHMPLALKTISHKFGGYHRHLVLKAKMDRTLSFYSVKINLGTSTKKTWKCFVLFAD